jgi:ABC-type molybdate transport system permease subunit
MALWKKLWLLFAVIWLVVAGLNVATILAFSEDENERAKALVPLVLAPAVPAAAYLLLWSWFRFRRKKQ